MRTEEVPWKHGAVLVCTNERGPDAARPSCGRIRGLKLREWLKHSSRAGGGAGAQCRVLASSCLDVCPDDGVAVAILPGEEILVVNPDADRPALLAAVQEHMQQRAEGGRGRKVLSRLRSRVKR